MDEIRKQFLKIRKKLWMARKHAAKGNTGAAERVKGWEGDLQCTSPSTGSQVASERIRC